MAGFVERAAAEMGGLDVLVNNVGVFRKVPLAELTEDVLDEAFDVNVKAAVMASRVAAPHMRRRGGGSIVNVASLGGLRPWPSYVAYCASKAALVMATQCLALALAPEIRVNAVAPGILDPPGAGEAVRQKIPQARYGTPAEVVEWVLFLAAYALYFWRELRRDESGEVEEALGPLMIARKAAGEPALGLSLLQTAGALIVIFAGSRGSHFSQRPVGVGGAL